MQEKKYKDVKVGDRVEFEVSQVVGGKPRKIKAEGTVGSIKGVGGLIEAVDAKLLEPMNIRFYRVLEK